MKDVLLQAGILIGAYFLGGIPFAFIATHLIKGVDIRLLGDGNVGAKNTFISAGPVAGVIAGAGDIGKGMLAVVLARALSGSVEIAMVAGMAAVLGHDFSPFLGFEGGQGMAAMLGAFFVLFPLSTIVAIAVCFAVLGIFRNWDAAWAIGFVALIVLTVAFGYGWGRALFTLLLIPTIGLRKMLQGVIARRKAAERKGS
jgi:glycerol-3-phosphate acyltransferase PlsY